MAYLGLGSNLGERRRNIAAALELLAQVSERVTCSSAYRSRPQGYDAQPWFLNAVCGVLTRLDPFSLLKAARDIQTTVGGQRAFTNGPRRLDIDILLYGGSVVSAPGLMVPHPRLAQREFVLAPLAELSPNLRHPISGETVRSLLMRLPDRGETLRVGPVSGQPGRYALSSGGSRLGIESSIG